MYKKVLKKAISFLLSAAVILALFSGCSKSEKAVDFIYPFSADVNSYDPQVAATSDEFLIVENTFEGLIRVNDDNKVQKGCAESWNISADKKNYTFNLKKGLKWNLNFDKYEDGDKKGQYKDDRVKLMGADFNPDITADDFVFALQRAADPSTNCPLFPSISSITNAAEIHSGQAVPDTLGAKALGDYTLEITLSSPDDAFLQTLSGSVAMPCNREFFNACKGRYGLGEDYTLFNGQFYVSQILEESYLLKKNENYKGFYPASADELTLKIVNGKDDSDNDVTKNLDSGYYDAAFITGSESEKLKNSKGINYVPYEDTSWVLMLNTNNEVFQSKKMREAFCLGLSRPKSIDKKYLHDTRNLIPSACELNSKSVKELSGDLAPAPDSAQSLNLWQEGLKVIDEDSVSITILTTPEMENTLKLYLQGIQSGISSVTKNADGDPFTCSIKVETHTQNEILTLLRTGEYDAAFYPYKSVSSSAVSFLKTFSQNNRTGFDSKKFDTALDMAQKASSPTEELKYVTDAENELISTYSIFPIVSETSYYASAKGVSGIQFHAGSGRVSFVNAKRK